MNNSRRVTEGIVDEVKDRFSDILDEAQDRGERLLTQAKSRGTALLEEAQGKSQEALKGANSWVRKNPGAALACAFIAGALVYALMRSDSDSSEE